MNMKFKNFDFDLWLKEYITTLLYANVLDLSPEMKESEFVAIDEKRQHFYEQHHNVIDEYWCMACEYQTMLDEFNRFMILISRPDWDILDLYKLLVRGISNSKSREICKTNMYKLLNTLQIPYNDGETKTDI